MPSCVTHLHASEDNKNMSTSLRLHFCTLRYLSVSLKYFGNPGYPHPAKHCCKTNGVCDLRGDLGLLCDTLQILVVCLWHFGWPWGTIVAPWLPIWTHVKYSLESFGHFRAPLGSIWVPLASMLVSCGHFGVWPWTPWVTFVEKASKRHPKWTPEWRHFH